MSSRRHSLYKIPNKMMIRRFKTCTSLKTIRVHPMIANLIASLADVPPTEDVFVEDLRFTDALLQRLLEFFTTSQLQDETKENFLDIFEYAAKNAKIGSEICKRLMYLFVKNFERAQALSAFKSLAERFPGVFKNVALEMAAKGVSLIELIDIFVSDNIALLPDAIDIGALVAELPEMRKATKMWVSSLISTFSDLEEHEKVMCLGFFESFVRDAGMCRFMLRDDAIEDLVSCQMVPATAERVMDWLMAVGESVKLKKGIVKMALKNFEEFIQESEAFVKKYCRLLVIALEKWPVMFRKFVEKHQLLQVLSEDEKVDMAMREARTRVFALCCMEASDDEITVYPLPSYLYDICFLLSEGRACDFIDMFLTRYSEYMQRCPDAFQIGETLREFDWGDKLIGGGLLLMDAFAKNECDTAVSTSNTVAI